MRRLPLFLLCLFVPLVACSGQVQRGEPLARSGFLGVQSAPGEGGKGIKVVRILPGGTFEALGLKTDDVVLSLNGTAITSPQQFGLAARTLRGGDSVKVTYLRGGNESNVEGKVSPRPKQVEDGLDVIYDQVVSQGKRIRVIITKPKGAGKFPAFFYIGGIGAYSLDTTFANMFAAAGKVLESIAKAGYVTVRIDKPGQGDSEGPVYKELGFGVEKDAYLQALRLTKTLDFVDPDKIAIFGHSMGGTFGPLVAAEEPVKAVIVLGTLFKTFPEYMMDNTRRQAELGGGSAESVDTALRETFQATYHLFQENLSPREMVDKYPNMRNWASQSTPDMETYSGVGIPFFRELGQINIADAWTKVKGDVLAIYCENDFLCCQDDHERIAALANKLRPGSGEFILLKGADHLLRKTTSQLNSMQTWPQPTEFNPNILDTLQGYLKKKLG